MIPTNHEKDGTVWSARGWRRVKLAALGLSALMATGIVALMMLAAGKGEDITGIVAPALAITVASGLVAVVAAFRQKRAPQQH
ncbi:MAG: hypothetical protein U1F61_11695 [Opitutaceae bacterium]